MKTQFIVIILGVIFLSSCVSKPTLLVRDYERTQSVKKIAVLPFFDTRFLSAVDPLYESDFFSTMPSALFDKNAKKILKKRYEILGQDQTILALKKQGVSYVSLKKVSELKTKAEETRWGYSVQQGVEAGRALGVDAVLLGVQGEYLEKEDEPVQAITLRLVSTQTGKTIYGISGVGKPGIFSRDKVVKQILFELMRKLP